MSAKRKLNFRKDFWQLVAIAESKLHDDLRKEMARHEEAVLKILIHWKAELPR